MSFKRIACSFVSRQGRGRGTCGGMLGRSRGKSECECEQVK